MELSRLALTFDMEERLTTRPNGQDVAYFEYGDSPNVLFFHHATQAAGPLARMLKDQADLYKFRIIEVVRPGYGKTSSLPERAIFDVADINLDIANNLEIERFGILGYSGGGPHALAAACSSQNRCVGTVVVAGMAPFLESNFDFYAGMDEANVNEWMSSQKDIQGFKEEIAQYVAQWSTYDFAKLKSIFNAGTRSPLSDEWIESFSVNSKYSFQQGPEGIIEDSLAFLKPWGFSPADIQTPVQLWAGDTDVIAPVGHARWLQQEIAGSALSILEGKDHNSVVEPAWEAGLAWMREIFDDSQEARP